MKQNSLFRFFAFVITLCLIFLIFSSISINKSRRVTIVFEKCQTTISNSQNMVSNSQNMASNSHFQSENLSKNQQNTNQTSQFYFTNEIFDELEYGITIIPLISHAYCYLHDTYVDSGAVAYYMNEENEIEVLQVETIGKINTNLAGSQFLIYRAINSLGEKKILEKPVEVLYSPIVNISLTCLTYPLENSQYIDFHIDVSSENNGISNPKQSYLIYRDGRFCKKITSHNFYIEILELGRTVVSVETSGKNINGEIVSINQKINLDINDIFWWQDSDVPLLLLLFILTFLMTIYFISFSFLTPIKAYKFLNTENSHQKIKIKLTYQNSKKHYLKFRIHKIIKNLKSFIRKK